MTQLSTFDAASVLRHAIKLSTQAGTQDRYEALMMLDDRLVQKGFVPMSPFWKEVMRAFYAALSTTEAYRVVARVGRRGGKSSTMCRVAVAEVVYRDWPISKGDRGVFAFLSTTTGEAEERLRTICDILDAIGMVRDVDYRDGGDRRGKFVKLLQRPLLWRALPANFRTAVGFTCIGAVCDELARWLDERTGRNPASDVLTSLRPAMATMRKHGAMEALISSPWSELDAHHDAFVRGDTGEQRTFYAPTWVANPTLTEANCRAFAQKEAEKGELSDFDREYRAVPMPVTEEAMFDSVWLARSVVDYPVPCRPHEGAWLTAGADFGFARDHSALAIVERLGQHYKLLDALERRPRPGSPLSPSSVIAEFTARLKAYDMRAVMADRHYREAIFELLSAQRLGLLDAPNDVSGPFVRFKSLLHQQRVTLPNDAGLIRDLKETRCKPTASGKLSVELPKRAGGGHADLVSALVLATWQTGGVRVDDQDGIASPKNVHPEAARMRAAAAHAVRVKNGTEVEGSISHGENAYWDDPLDWQ